MPLPPPPPSPTKVAVLGAGSFGSAMVRMISLALAAGHPGAELSWYARRTSVADEINSERTNSQYFPCGTFLPCVTATSDVVECVRKADIVVLAVPTAYLPPLLDLILADHSASLSADAVICSVLKSIKYDAAEAGGRGRILTSIDVVRRHLRAAADGRYAATSTVALSGPNLYSEMAVEGEIAEATVGYDTGDEAAADLVRRVTSSPAFRTSLLPDRRGLELCGGLKNVLALAVGYLEGMGMGWNARSATVRAGMHEMCRFIDEVCVEDGDEDRTAAGGSRATVFETAGGVGDLILTCTAGRGRTLAAAFVKKVLAEGSVEATVAAKSDGGEEDEMSEDELLRIASVERWEGLENELLNGMRLPDWHNAQYVYRALEGRGLLGTGQFPLLEQVYSIGFLGSSPSSIVDALSRSIVVADRRR